MESINVVRNVILSREISLCDKLKNFERRGWYEGLEWRLDLGREEIMEDSIFKSKVWKPLFP